MSTRQSIIEQAARQLGGYTGSITSGTATTAVLGELLGGTGDNNFLVGDLLIMMDAANAADQIRTITAWVDSTGTATWVGNRTDTDYSNETYVVLPGGTDDMNLATIRSALNDRLDQTRRTVASTLPTLENHRFYSLGRFDWIRNRDDVDKVFYRVSPNMVDNGNFDVWGNGLTSAPSHWIAGSATVARNDFLSNPARITRGHFGLSLTGSGGTGTMDQFLPTELVIQLRGLPLTLEADVTAGAITELISITDEGGTTAVAHTGGGTVERLSATRTINASADSIRFRLQAASGVTGQFDNVMAEEGTALQQPLSDTGDDAWRLQDLSHEVRDIGGVPVIELPRARGRKSQLVVFSRQQYPALTADTQTTDCPDYVIVPGLKSELARILRKGVERERWDRIRQEAAAEYGRTAGSLIQIPQPNPQHPVIVRSG